MAFPRLVVWLTLAAMAVAAGPVHAGGAAGPRLTPAPAEIPTPLAVAWRALRARLATPPAPPWDPQRPPTGAPHARLVMGQAGATLHLWRPAPGRLLVAPLADLSDAEGSALVDALGLRLQFLLAADPRTGTAWPGPVAPPGPPPIPPEPPLPPDVDHEWSRPLPPTPQPPVALIPPPPPPWIAPSPATVVTPSRAPIDGRPRASGGDAWLGAVTTVDRALHLGLQAGARGPVAPGWQIRGGLGIEPFGTVRGEPVLLATASLGAERAVGPAGSGLFAVGSLGWQGLWAETDALTVATAHRPTLSVGAGLRVLGGAALALDAVLTAQVSPWALTAGLGDGPPTEARNRAGLQLALQLAWGL